MPDSQQARMWTRLITRTILVAGLVVVVAVVSAGIGGRSLTSSSSTVISPTDVVRSEGAALDEPDEAGAAASPVVVRSEAGGAPNGADGAVVSRREQRGAPGGPAVVGDEQGGPFGTEDGAVPDGVTVFDDETPAVAKLDPGLLDALRQAATDAANDEVEIFVESGWRSAEYQERLLREAVSEYGSEAEAARWVATADTSAHVSGSAIDIGHSDAMAWLSEHGAEYGLCQIYSNEPWHYELLSEAINHGCPSMYADPTHDPRMQQ